jgi:hypothetical protein
MSEDMEEHHMLSDQEIKALTASLMTDHRGFTQSDLQRVIDWALDVKFQYTMFALVQSGELDVSIVDEQIRFIMPHERCVVCSTWDRLSLKPQRCPLCDPLAVSGGPVA